MVQVEKTRCLAIQKVMGQIMMIGLVVVVALEVFHLVGFHFITDLHHQLRTVLGGHFDLAGRSPALLHIPEPDLIGGDVDGGQHGIGNPNGQGFQFVIDHKIPVGQLTQIHGILGIAGILDVLIA